MFSSDEFAAGLKALMAMAAKTMPTAEEMAEGFRVAFSRSEND